VHGPGPGESPQSPHSLAALGQRTLAERVGLRWPRLTALAIRSVLRLPPGSRARNALLKRAARTAFLAWNRGDFELVPKVDDPGVETHFAEGAGVALGIDAVYYGPAGHCRAMETWNEAWQFWDAEIDEVIEQGHDQVLIVARLFGEGAASGIKLDEWGAVRYTFRGGRIVRVDASLDSNRDRALRALPSAP
jgi:ketosteroid isomerase-like protein